MLNYHNTCTWTDALVLKKNKQYNQYIYNKRHHFPFTLVKLFTIL